MMVTVTDGSCLLNQRVHSQVSKQRLLWLPRKPQEYRPVHACNRMENARYNTDSKNVARKGQRYTGKNKNRRHPKVLSGLHIQNVELEPGDLMLMHNHNPRHS